MRGQGVMRPLGWTRVDHLWPSSANKLLGPGNWLSTVCRMSVNKIYVANISFWGIRIGLKKLLPLIMDFGRSALAFRGYRSYPSLRRINNVNWSLFLFLLGMRYKRRGVDKNGNVANYVETEQLIHVHNHTLSFVQTRGSVPVFWSQVGYRYNPRPRLDKSKYCSSVLKDPFPLFTLLCTQKWTF